MVYSLEDPKSFDSIEEYWLPSIQNYGPAQVKIALVGIQGDTKENEDSLTMGNQKLSDFIELNEIRIWSVLSFDNIPAINEIFQNLAAALVQQQSNVRGSELILSRVCESVIKASK